MLYKDPSSFHYVMQKQTISLMQKQTPMFFETFSPSMLLLKIRLIRKLENQQ